MPKPVSYLNEIVSLTVMLLMVVALVAGQADATIHDEARADSGFSERTLDDEHSMPFRTRITAHIDGEPLTISIDASAEFDFFPSRRRVK